MQARDLDMGNNTDHPHNTVYHLQPLKKPGGKSKAGKQVTNRNQDQTRNSVVLRPQNYYHETTITMASSLSGNTAGNEDASRSRNDSKELIITKEVGWELRHGGG